MSTWTVIRFLHLVGIVFFVGGQLSLVVAVTPVLRAGGNDEAMRAIARRFGMGSVVALAVVIATGAAMASYFDLWDSSVIEVKLMVLVLVGILTGLHVVSDKTRPIALAIVACSLLLVWLGVKLTYG